jgi:hypothetical protein
MRDETVVNCILKVVRPVICACFCSLDGGKVLVAEIDAADETGCVRVRVLNREEYLEQCETVKEGGTLVIRNAVVGRAGNLIRLEINSQSSIEQSSISFSKPLNQTPHLILDNN